MILKSDEMRIVKRILSLLKPYAKKVIVIFFCILVSAGISMVMPLISKEIMDSGLLKKDMEIIVKLSLLSLVLFIAEQGIGFLETSSLAYVNSILPYTLSKNAFKHMMKLKMQYFSNKNFAETMNNINMDVGNISMISDRGMFFIVSGVFKMIGGFIGLFVIDWKLTILVVLLIPFRFVLVKYLAKQRTKIFENYMQSSSEFSSWYGDTICGVKEIKLWGLERYKTGQFIKKQRNIIKSNIKFFLIDKLNELSETTLYQFLTSALYIFGAWMIFNDWLTVGGLFAFISYSIFVTSPLFAILNIGYNFTKIIPSAKRLFDFLDMECEGEKKDQRPLRIDNEVVKGNIRFENVTFSYDGKEQLLKDICFEIRGGEKIALIGANGAGKSTLINLLLRFHRPASGQIYLDDIDIELFDIRGLRKLISVVSQELYLFDSTIKENIELIPGKNDFRIFNALRRSTAHRFVDELPEKINTKVGRNGSRLSGGERQKIALARAFARDSRILVLDEATSNFDIESELQINEMLENGSEDKTVLAITHKPQLLKLFDRIIFLGKGHIEDIGTHEELLSRNEEYRSIVKSFDKEKENKAV